MKRTRIALGCCAVAALSAVTAGCGDDDAEDTGSAPASAPVSTLGSSTATGASATTQTSDAPVTSPDASETTASASSTVASATSTASAGDGAELDELIAAAEAEGSLTLYASNNEADSDRVIAAFEERYDIEVERIPRTTSAPLIQRFEAELAAGGSPADVISHTDLLWFSKALGDGSVVSMDAGLVPELSTYPQAFVNESSVTVNIQPLGACYNTSSVTEEQLVAYEDLYDEDLRLLIPTPAGSLATLSGFDVPQNEGGQPDFTQRIAARGANQVVESVVPGGQLLSAGEGDVMYPCYEVIAASAQASGAPVAFTVLGPTSGAEQAMGIPTAAPHPNAARLYLNFLMSEEGQAAFTLGNAASPRGTGVQGSLSLPDEYVPLASVIERVGANRDQILAELGLE